MQLFVFGYHHSGLTLVSENCLCCIRTNWLWRYTKHDNKKATGWKKTCSNLRDLFDIVTKDVMTEIQDEEDLEFLRMQRENIFFLQHERSRCKDSSKRKQDEATRGRRKVKMRYEKRTTKGFNETEGELSSLTSNSESEEDEEYQPTQTQPCRPTTSTSTDSTACASSLKKEIYEYLPVPWSCRCFWSRLPPRPWSCVCCWSCCTGAWPWHFRNKIISKFNQTIQNKRKTKGCCNRWKRIFLAGPLLLHNWDGKILPDIDGSNENVDRIAVIVTGNG